MDEEALRQAKDPAAGRRANPTRTVTSSMSNFSGNEPHLGSQRLRSFGMTQSFFPSRFHPEDPATDASAPEKADASVAEAVAPYRETSFVRALSAFSKLGDQPPMRVISGAVLVSGLLLGNQRLRRAGVRMIAAHTLATLAKDFIKHRVDRTRPDQLVDKGRYKMEPGHSEEHEETSFPSGHSAGAVAVARAFAREFPEYAALTESAASLIALGQVPRGTHFPTDVMAGSAIGFVSEWLVARFVPVSLLEP